MEREKKFTQGPWAVSDNGGPLEIYSKLKRWICSMPFLPNLQGEENKANANLISAAPDLLEACEEFIRKCECGEARSKRSYGQMKKALDKAYGTQREDK